MVYRPSIDQKLCFVLMPFGKPFDGYYEHVIKPAVTAADLEPLRADEIYGAQAIIKDIWESIWKARIVIADVSDRNPNVNYELGLCHALGVPTILITKQIEDVPFDYRHHRCLIYRTEEAQWENNLKSAIQKTIAALMAETKSTSDLRWPYDTEVVRSAAAVSGTLSIENPRDIMLRGVAEIERLAAKAYGPMGSHISVTLANTNVYSFKQGIRLVAGVHSSNPLEQNGIDQARQVAKLVHEAAGDGTKTALLLFCAILRLGHEALISGYPLAEFISGVDSGLSAALQSLTEQSKSSTAKEHHDIALTASNDPKIATVVSKAIDEAGEDGIITVAIGASVDPTLTVSEGLRFERGYLSEFFINAAALRECVFEDCRLLIYDRKISGLSDLWPLLEKVSRGGQPFLIIADDVEGEALSTLVVNALRGTLKCAAVRAPGNGLSRSAFLQDVAVLTGGSALIAEVGINLAAVTLADLGAAERVIVGKDITTIIGGKGNQRSIEAHVARLRSEIALAANAFDREKLQLRLSSFVGKIGTITVGGAAPPDLEDQRYRTESALHAARSAQESGWVCGGGVALLHARNSVLKLSLETEAARAGSQVVVKALERPFSALVEIGGRSPTQMLSELNNHAEEYQGFDAISTRVLDLPANGVIDSLQVIRKSLEISCSYAKNILRTGVWSLSEPAQGSKSQELES